MNTNKRTVEFFCPCEHGQHYRVQVPDLTQTPNMVATVRESCEQCGESVAFIVRFAPHGTMFTETAPGSRYVKVREL